MMNAEILNQKLQKEFEENKNYQTLERYVMSEVLSPIEDYYSAIDIIKRNSNLIEGLNLYYIAAYLCAGWLPESTEFLEKLNGMIDLVEDKEKAIIYYLNAYWISFTMDNWRKNDEYKFNLLKSIECSKNIRFVYNRRDLADILEGEEAKKYRKEAAENVVNILTQEELISKNLDYWLPSQRFIDEYILGIEMSKELYSYEFEGVGMGFQ